MNVQVVEVPSGCGSADALRSMKSLIKTDFLVLSCDLMTDIPPHVIINPHRSLNNSMTALFFDATNLEPIERLNKEGILLFLIPE